MSYKLPAVSKKLDNLRIMAQLVNSTGYPEIAIEIMRISRGEIKIQTGNKLFGLNASEINAAKQCTLKQRQSLAANDVVRAKLGVTEDDYTEALRKKAMNDLTWPDGTTKLAEITDAAKKHNLSPTSLERFMKTDDWEVFGFVEPNFQYPDWHPDSHDKLFHGEK